jgi:hypothetical protein
VPRCPAAPSPYSIRQNGSFGITVVSRFCRALVTSPARQGVVPCAFVPNPRGAEVRHNARGRRARPQRAWLPRRMGASHQFQPACLGGFHPPHDPPPTKNPHIRQIPLVVPNVRTPRVRHKGTRHKTSPRSGAGRSTDERSAGPWHTGVAAGKLGTSASEGLALPPGCGAGRGWEHESERKETAWWCVAS